MKLVTRQEVETALKDTIEPDKTTNKPPETCSYSSANNSLVTISHLTSIPVGQGIGTLFEGHVALRNDSTQQTPPLCSLFPQIGDLGGDTLGVTVRKFGQPNPCGIADELAHIAFTRLPREEP
ncbi:hypothetical protein [Amycolatopsis sp. CA-230715]|uniref:hypothetical protein n=1 Tax=Amycolatopsis sp. CA-230715 TaxID=2745196 RepID=UPI001C0348A1|nr:hypothetical protein [Amycolatopsis sp. CA-230715]